MRIECDSADDFLINLKNGEVVNGVVFVNKTQRSCDVRQSFREATSIVIGIQLTAVLEFGGGEALLMAGQECGIDRLTADGDTEGTRTFEQIMQAVYNHCNAANLKIRPGVLGV